MGPLATTCYLPPPLAAYLLLLLLLTCDAVTYLPGLTAACPCCCCLNLLVKAVLWSYLPV